MCRQELKVFPVYCIMVLFMDSRAITISPTAPWYSWYLRWKKEFFGNNPHTGHWINERLLFAGSCALFFRLLIILFKDFPLGKEISLAAVLLFASHPVHTEAVANIKGRDDILNFLFFVLSLTCLLQGVDRNKPKYFWLSALFFFLALLCKEIAVTFLAVIPLTVFFFRHATPKKIFSIVLSFAGVLGLYMLIRSSVLSSVTFEEKMKVVNNALAGAGSESDRIATAILILGKYAGLLFFPHPLSWDYSYNQIPIVSFSDIKVISTLCILGLAGIYAVSISAKMLKQRAGKTNEETSAHARTLNFLSPNPVSRTFAYCILFFFLTLSVVSNLFLLIGSTLGERFLFIPSLAFCMSLAVIFFFPLEKKPVFTAFPSMRTRGILFLLLLLAFSFKTFTRNRDWKDNLSLFTSGVQAAPHSSPGRKVHWDPATVKWEKKNRIYKSARHFFKKQLCTTHRPLKSCPKIPKRFTMQVCVIMEWATRKMH